MWSRAWRSLQSLEAWEASERPRADAAHAKPAGQEGADAAGTYAAGVDAAGAGAEEGLQPRLAAAVEEGLQPTTAGAPANYGAAVEALARMEIRAVSAELALSEARQVRPSVHCLCALRVRSVCAASALRLRCF